MVRARAAAGRLAVPFNNQSRPDALSAGARAASSARSSLLSPQYPLEESRSLLDLYSVALHGKVSPQARQPAWCCQWHARGLCSDTRSNRFLLQVERGTLLYAVALHHCAAFVFRDFKEASLRQWEAMEVRVLVATFCFFSFLLFQQGLFSSTSLSVFHCVTTAAPLSTPRQGDAHAEQHRHHMLRRFVAALSDPVYRDLLGYTVQAASLFSKTRTLPTLDDDVVASRKQALVQLANSDAATRALVARRHPSWVD